MARSKKRKERQRVSARRRAEDHQVSGQSRSIQIPEGVEWFAPDDKHVYKLDILSYRVGKGNPFAKPGETYFERTFHTHRGIGANQETFVCPAKSANRRCPICEALRTEEDDDLRKALRAKERQLWLLYDLDQPGQLKLWDVSYYLFGDQLDKRVKNSDEEDGYEYFADLEDGLTLKVGFDKESFGGNNFYKTASIDFARRKQQYSDDLLDELPCLDDLLIIEPYDKLKSVFLQLDDDVDIDDEDEEVDGDEDGYESTKPSPKSAKPIEDEEAPWDSDDEDDEVDEDEYEPVKPKKKAKAKSAKKKPAKASSKAEVNGDELDEDDEFDDDELEDSGPPERKPGKSKKKKAKAKVAATVEVDEDDDEDWDADWDDE